MENYKNIQPLSEFDWEAFSDKEKIKYRIGHSLDETKNYHGSVQGESNEEINEQWQISNSHKGKTTSLVIVIYSDREKEEQ